MKGIGEAMKKRVFFVLVIFFIIVLGGINPVFAKLCSDCGGSMSQIVDSVATCEKAGIAAWRCSSCGHEEELPYSKLGHTGGTATCKSKKKCTRCGKSYGDYADHTGGTATCTAKAKCKVCGKSYGNYGSHSYTRACSQPHCDGKVCSVCGEHKGTCDGGHTYINCSHCGTSYCSKCNDHTPKVSCPCNSDKSCSDPHCVGITWCSYCGSHSHVPCNTNATCPLVHCYASVCSVCGKNHQGYCNGGHKWKWVTEDSGETQTHTNVCSVSGCSATNGTHTSSWGSGNSNHTSTCKKCNLTYTHSANWSTERRSATEPHPCAWWGGCSATHTATWGEYYKTSGKDGDSSGAPHTRTCSTCGIEEIYHNYSTESWTWNTTATHIRICSTCGLKQSESHRFNKNVAKDVDDVNHKDLEKHWMICTTCDENHKEVDEIHEDNGNGVCVKCGKILWKVICDGENVTEKVKDEESAEDAFRRAVREETIKIIESKDGIINYIKEINGPSGTLTATNNEIKITENGEYTFTTIRGGTGSFVIDNISREILIDKIPDPITSTTGQVEITVRSNKAEEKFNKEIFIKQVTEAQYENNTVSITDAELNTGSNPFIYLDKTTGEKPKVNQNGKYYFIARDTAGNTLKIMVVIDNIIKGQATVAISNDVFVNGYVFTDILVNPSKNWTLPIVANENIKVKAYKVGNITGNESYLGSNEVKLVKVMDMRGKDVLENQEYLPGEYYVQVAIGGTAFSTAGTYIVDLEYVTTDQGERLQGKNRIIVEVKNLNDLT